MDDTNKNGAGVVGPDGAFGAFVAGSTEKGAGVNVTLDCRDVSCEMQE